MTTVWIFLGNRDPSASCTCSIITRVSSVPSSRQSSLICVYREGETTEDLHSCVRCSISSPSELSSTPRKTLRPQSDHSFVLKHVFIKILLDDVHTTCDVDALLVDADQYVTVVWILKDLRLEDRGIQCHGQTDRMGHDQIFLGDLGGFRMSDTGIFAGFALCIACCKFGKSM